MKNEKFTAIQTLFENRFLNFYHMDALTNTGHPFDYYFVSRNKADKIKAKTKSGKAEGIVIYPILREDPNKIVLIKQYRYPIGDYLYELPAGLIDDGETAEQAAVREMKEETGLEFTVYEGGFSGFRRPFFMGAGYTDEASSAVFGYVESLEGEQMLEDTERIQVLIADKNMAKKILSEEKVSLRCAYLMMQFIGANAENPFQFLEI